MKHKHRSDECDNIEVNQGCEGTQREERREILEWKTLHRKQGKSVALFWEHFEDGCKK